MNAPVDIKDLEKATWLSEEARNSIRSKQVRCEVEPGDALYLPAFWWHEVESIAEAVNFRGERLEINLAVSRLFITLNFLTF